ncbi:MAG: molybdopterin cofactor-binding domain-containing protein, partial [Oceanisphaera sp.]|nr:molybdopterin cofactor-binding domain-containing protein [Oceanisphaera sp.]
MLTERDFPAALPVASELLKKAPAAPARRDGDPEAAFARADKIIESTYSAPYLAHNCMEPMNFYAHVTPEKAELKADCDTPRFAASGQRSLASHARYCESRDWARA